MSSVGVVTLPTDISEEWESHSFGSSQNGLLKKLCVKSGISVWPLILIQSVTGQRTAAAANRSVCPITQLESTPPPLHPETYMRVVSTQPLPTTASTPAIRSS